MLQSANFIQSNMSILPIKTGVAYIKDFDDECKRKIARISYQIFCLWVIKKNARHLVEYFSNLGHWAF